MRLILAELWPIFIPLSLYILWRFYQRRQARLRGDIEARLWNQRLFWLSLATLLLALGGLLFYGLSASPNDGRNYQPLKREDGVLVPPSLD